MQVSNRLIAVSDMVSTAHCMADVGTDHGYIPIYLVEQQRIERAIAMDVNAGPLARAREHIKAYGMGDRIDIRLSDGVAALLPGEADSVVIAGMGGGLVRKILKEGETVLKQVNELVLQPQSELAQVRAFLMEEGYRITREDMVLEDGKYYPMMRAERGSMDSLSHIELKYGPLLLREKHPCLKLFLDREHQVYDAVYRNLLQNGSERAEERIIEIERELEQVREAKEIIG